jgi:hypothetical protein
MGLRAVHGVRRASFWVSTLGQLSRRLEYLRFCSVRRVNLGEVSGGVASPSVAPMQDKKDLGALGTGRGVFSPKRRH